MKICKQCQKEKTYDEFVKHKGYIGGLYCYCKECMRLKNKEYKPTEEAKEKRILGRSSYRERNRDRIREQDRQHYNENPEKFKEKAKINMAKYLKEKGFQKREERFEKHPEILKARLDLTEAVRSGKLKKPNVCQICEKVSNRVEGHHHDYSLSLDVIWLCVPCHRKIHRKDNHGERLSEKTPKGDATVRTTKETCGEKSEVVSPPTIVG